MKPLLALILLGFLTACASRPNEALQDPSEVKAETKAREEFAKTLPKPRENQ